MLRTLNVNLSVEYELRVKNCRILVLDDLTANVKLLENVLHRLGYKHIRGETDARRVTEIAQEWKPDLLILDLGMPHLDGFGVLDLFRAGVPKEEWIPILVLTANSDPVNRRKALAAGATEFLGKPFDTSELIWRIRNTLIARIYTTALRDQNQVLEQRVVERTEQLSNRTVELEGALKGLQNAQQQIVQTERFRAFAEMAGGIAHDFNNVLQCVIGYTDLLLQNRALLDEKDTVTEFLQVMNTAGLDASTIVSRLKNFYRPKDEAEVFTLVDVNRLLREVVPLTQPKWQAQALASGRVVDLRYELGELPPVPCNAPEIRELLVNLVFNAVDAMPNGGVITLRTTACERFACIAVSDTGIGMTEEVKQRCMEPFFSTKGENGTGLGLSMLFGIVLRHEGEVRIESEPGRGTTVLVYIPLVAKEVTIEEEEAAPLQTMLKVLVVDDDPLPRDVIARYLRQDGHQVTSLGSAREAIALHLWSKFDLIITDQAMPHVTGLQLARAARDTAPSQRIILITGFEDTASRPGAEDDVDILLKKPVSQNGLRRAMAQALAKRPLPIESAPFARAFIQPGEAFAPRHNERLYAPT